MRRFIGQGNFMTSRINWAIQSSGVDYLHLLIVSPWNTSPAGTTSTPASLSPCTTRSAIWLKKEDKYRCAMALQVANVWTRAMFSQQMGIDDLPQSCAYFSAVDIDHVLRKEVDMDCVTPSHPDKILPGESLDILQLLSKGDEAFLDPAVQSTDPPQPERFEYTYRQPVMESLNTPNALHYLRAQIAPSTAELNKIVKDLKSPTASKLTDLNDDPSPSRTSSTTSPPKTRKPRAKPTTSPGDDSATRKKTTPRKPRPKPIPATNSASGSPVRRYMQSPSLLPVDTAPWQENTFVKWYDHVKRKEGWRTWEAGMNSVGRRWRDVRS